jgi:hypothetical protein
MDKEILAYINGTPEIQSILYDLDLLPEQCTTHPPNQRRAVLIAELFQEKERLRKRCEVLAGKLLEKMETNLANESTIFNIEKLLNRRGVV